MPGVASARRSLGRILRETLAPVTWCYALLKLGIYDIDKALLNWVSPGYVWVLNFKFFLLLAFATMFLLALGPRQFILLVLFILFYPFVVLFWKIPKRYYRQWPLVVVFLPAIGEAISQFWSTFVLVSVAALGAVFTLVDNRVINVIGIACLIPMMAVHLARSLRRAYAASLLTRLIALVARVHQAIEAGTFVPWDEKAAVIGYPQEEISRTASIATSDPRQVAYSFHAVVGIIAERIKTTAKRRHYDLYLTASWFHTVLLTAVTFAFIHFALNKAIPGAYANTTGVGFWSFAGYSLDILTGSNISKINPISDAANIASYAEKLCGLVVLFILVFSILTAGREALRDNLNDLVNEINAVGDALALRIRTTFQLTVVQLELALFAEMPTYVNSFRKYRGLPELPTSGGAAGASNETEEGGGGAA